MNIVRLSTLTAVLAIVVGAPNPVHATGPTICYSSSIQNASDSTGSLPTSWYANNDRGQRAGVVSMGNGDSQGVVFDRGQFTFVVVDGSSYTQLYALNNRGTAGGVYLDASGNFRPFLYDIRTGAIEKVTPADPTSVYQEVTSINDFGVIGAFYYRTFADAPVSFVARKVNGTWSYTTVPLPGVNSGINDINNLGDVVGNFLDANGVWHGFIVTRPGTSRAQLTQLDEPGSTVTFVYGINDFRWITGMSDARVAGSFFGASGAFVHRLRRGDWLPVDVPQATEFTFSADVNNWGQVTGAAVGSQGGQGFVARPRLCR